MEYRIVLADPPWDFAPPHMNNKDIDSWWNAGHELSQAQLESATLPIAKRAILFLWVPAAILPKGIALLQAWGFNYDGEVVWVKVKKDGTPGYGLGGHFIKYTHECLLIGLRGKIPYWNSGVIPSAIFAPRLGGHGQKPDEQYEMIEHTARVQHIEPPFLQLFARRPREGWHTHGNTIGADVHIPEWDILDTEAQAVV